jgi:hypothetical protein
MHIDVRETAGVSPVSARRALQPTLPSLRPCFVQEKGWALVVVILRIDAAGKVARSSAGSATARFRATPACVQSALEKLTLPQSRRPRMIDARIGYFDQT